MALYGDPPYISVGLDDGGSRDGDGLSTDDGGRVVLGLGDLVVDGGGQGAGAGLIGKRMNKV